MSKHTWQQSHVTYGYDFACILLPMHSHYKRFCICSWCSVLIVARLLACVVRTVSAETASSIVGFLMVSQLQCCLLCRGVPCDVGITACFTSTAVMLWSHQGFCMCSCCCHIPLVAKMLLLCLPCTLSFDASAQHLQRKTSIRM